MRFQTDMNNSAEFQHKKQAIHGALRTVLSPEEAALAVDTWAEYANPSTSAFNGINHFARTVCEIYGKNGRHTELVQAMIKALMDGGNQHAEDAETVTHERPQTVFTSTEETMLPEIRTAEFSSFQVLLQSLLHEILEHDAGTAAACRQFLLNAVDNLPWSPEQQFQVVSLINTGSAMQTRPYRAGQLASLMRHLSVWMKDILGADVAARLVRHAVGKAERNAVCVAYPPVEFIADCWFEVSR